MAVNKLGGFCIYVPPNLTRNCPRSHDLVDYFFTSTIAKNHLLTVSIETTIIKKHNIRRTIAMTPIGQILNREKHPKLTLAAKSKNGRPVTLPTHWREKL